MKTPIELWDGLSIAGKVMSWWVIPVYYFVYGLLMFIAVIAAPIAMAWEDFQ